MAMKEYFLKPTGLYDEARRRKQELDGICTAMEQRLSRYPPGKIHVVNSRGRVQYYIRYDPTEKSGRYLPKTQEKKIRLYLQKKYDEDILKLLSTEIAALECLLEKTPAGHLRVQEIFSAEPEEIRNLLCPVDMTDADFQEQWMRIPFEGKKILPDVPFYLSEKGELNIANALNRHKIPYKYECPIRLSDGHTIHPDFTVLDSHRRQEVYWEHRGMMDDRQYAAHAVLRMKKLRMSGIFPGERLILTEETAGSPLGTDESEAVIRHYFE